jgi:hypothetical protein
MKNLNKIEAEMSALRLQEKPLHQEYMQISASLKEEKAIWNKAAGDSSILLKI